VRNRIFGPDVLPGSVLDGDWDLDCPLFEELAAFQSIRDRIICGVAWRETSYFAESMRDIEGGRPLWGCHNAGELEARLAYVDLLVESVKKYGLLPQNKVDAEHDPTLRYSDEAEINIGRNGDLLFQDGRHRMCIAKVLDVPLIPLKVRVRHRLWQEFREELFALRKNIDKMGKWNILPQPAPHPDLGDIPAYAGAIQCLEQVLRQITGAHACVLDLGCRLGFFSHALDKEGHEITAIEENSLWRAAADRLRLSESRNFKLLSGWQPSEYKGKPFDFVLMIGNAPGWTPIESELSILSSVLAFQAFRAPSVIFITHFESIAPAIPEPLAHVISQGILFPPRVIAHLSEGLVLMQSTRCAS